VRLPPCIRRLAAPCACLLTLAAPAGADRDGDAERAREGVRAGRYVPVESLLDWLEARYFGRAIEIELEEDEGEGDPPTYEIEWLTPQDHVIEFEFDARNGALLEIDGRGLEEARRR
jgi:uncharacterized membrane protein YkoI